MTEPTHTHRSVFGWIVLALLAWGVFLAIGVYLVTRDPRQPWVVLGCISLFVGGWLMLLRFGRSGRAADEDDDEAE